MFVLRYPLLFCIIVFIIWLTYEIKKHSHIANQQHENFWEKERQANSVRKKSLDSLHYITVPLESLPIFEKNHKKLIKYESEIKKLAEKKIVNLNGISNTDLKMEFGASNITELTEYDENYTQLVCLLHNWGKTLSEEGYIDEAITVLEFGIACKTDISGHYKLLCSLYEQTGTPEKIKDLITSALELESISKKSILSHLMEHVQE